MNTKNRVAHTGGKFTATSYILYIKISVYLHKETQLTKNNTLHTKVTLQVSNSIINKSIGF